MTQTLKFGIMYNGSSLKKWQLLTVLYLIKNKNPYEYISKGF